MKLTFNKEDWSGENVTINVNTRGNCFKLYGYTIKLKERPVAKIDDDYIVRVWDLFIDNKLTDYKVYACTWADKPTEYSAQDYSGEFERFGANIYEAAAKLLCNLL